jgi:hypothetical protein
MKNKHNRALLIILALFSALSGCGNPTDANNDNFEKAIDEYYSNSQNCISSEPLLYRDKGRKEVNIWSHFPLQFYRICLIMRPFFHQISPRNKLQ